VSPSVAPVDGINEIRVMRPDLRKDSDEQGVRPLWHTHQGSMPWVHLTGMNQFLAQLEVTFRRDPTNFRPRISKFANPDCIDSTLNYMTFKLQFHVIAIEAYTQS